MSNYQEKTPFCNSFIYCIDNFYGRGFWGYRPIYRGKNGPVFYEKEMAMEWIEKEDIKDKENIFKTLKFKRDLAKYLKKYTDLTPAQRIVVWKVFYVGSISDMVEIQEWKIKEKTIKFHLTRIIKVLKVKKQKGLVLHILGEMIKKNYMNGYIETEKKKPKVKKPEVLPYNKYKSLM